MAIAILFLVSLLVIGLISTFLKIPTKKMRFLFFLSQSLSPQTAQKEIKMAINKNCSFNSSLTRKKSELQSVFDTFDKNKDGFITKQELSDSLNNIGIFTSERDLIEMVERVDVNGDGLIDFDEFREVFESIMDQKDEEFDDEDGDLKEAFDVFDGDKNGFISVEELGLVLGSLGFKEGKKLENCKEMIKKVDIDGDGMINFLEFKNMMNNGASLISLF